MPFADCYARTSTSNQKYSLETSGAVGAGIGHVAATTLLGPFGAIIFPGGVAIATTGGAGVGLGLSKSKENKAREVILADCMKDRGYKAYSGS